MSSIDNIQPNSDFSSQELDTDLLTLDELGAFICQRISWYNYSCEYLLYINEMGSNDIILIIDNVIYTRTLFVPYYQNDNIIIRRLWEPVKINFSSIFRRERDGKGISYLPI